MSKYQQSQVSREGGGRLNYDIAKKEEGFFYITHLYQSWIYMCMSPSITKVQRIKLEQEQVLKELSKQKKQRGNDKKSEGII